MSLAKTMDDLERHLDYASSYFKDVQQELEELENDYIGEIHELQKDVETLEEQNQLLEEQVADLNFKLAIFELENMELRLKVEVYALDL
jgi:chromosome segregation ATPase